MPRRPVKPKRRAEAVALAREHGAAEAARQLGLPPSTIRSWMHRAGVVSEARSVASASPAQEPMETPEDTAAPGDVLAKAEHRAAAAWSVASRALERAAEAVAAGDGKGARDMAVVVGILTDKAARIEEGIGALRERESRIDQAQAERLGEIIRLAIVAIVGSDSRPVREVIRELIVQGQSGGPLAASPELAERAREDVRRLLHESEQAQHPRLALPAPSGEESVDGVIVGEPEPVEPSEEIPEAQVVEAPAEDIPLIPLVDVPRLLKNRYTPDEAGQARAQLAYSEHVHRIEAERLAAEAAATQERIKRRDAARRAAREKQANTLPPMAKRGPRGPW
jgi:hypothetical protein